VYLPLESDVVKRQLSLSVAILALFVVFTWVSPHFLTFRNLSRILENLPHLGLMALGMSFVMMAGGIDISAESVLGVAAICLGQIMFFPIPGWLAFWVAPVVGALLGLVNGLIIIYGKLSPIIATLGTLYVWRALIFLLVGGGWLTGVPQTYAPIVKNDILGIPIPFVLLIIITAILMWVFHKTSFGWHILAIGDNEESARLAGVNTRKVKLIAYTLMGTLVGLGAFLYIGRYRSVEMTVAQGMSLEAIAATVIGGTSILGGEGSVFGCIRGVFFIRVGQNGMVLMHMPSIWDNFVLGFLIVVALCFDYVLKRSP